MGQCGKLLTLIISLSPPPPVLQDGVGIQLLLIKSAPRGMVSLISVSSRMRRVLCKRIVTSFCFGQDLNMIEQSMISHTLRCKKNPFFFKWIKPQHCSKGSLLVSCSSMYSHTSHWALQYTQTQFFIPSLQWQCMCFCLRWCDVFLPVCSVLCSEKMKHEAVYDAILHSKLLHKAKAISIPSCKHLS